MKRRSTFAAVGGYQPFLFAIGMYFAALFFSMIICSAIFRAINSPASTAKANNVKEEKTALINTGQQVLLTVTK